LLEQQADASNESYAFVRGGWRYRVVWTNTTTTHLRIALPASDAMVYSVVGNNITARVVEHGYLTVGFEPMVIKYWGAPARAISPPVMHPSIRPVDPPHRPMYGPCSMQICVSASDQLLLEIPQRVRE
jgi:hypothetical protein